MSRLLAARPASLSPHNRRYWLNLLRFGAFFGVIALVTIGLAIGFMLSSVYLHPNRYRNGGQPVLQPEGVPFQEITLTTRDGLKLAAWYTPSQNGAVILVAHGWASQRQPAFHELFARHAYGVISWDFRAHGQSEGNVTTFGLHEALDVEAALDFALTQAGSHHVGAWGGSMGGAATILAAADRPEIEAVIIDSTYPSLRDEFYKAIDQPGLRALIALTAWFETGLRPEDLRPIDEIGRISPRPVLLIQGEADQSVPADSAQRLYAAAGEPRQLWSEAGVRHLQMFSDYPQEYERRVMEFFDRVLLPDPR